MCIASGVVLPMLYVMSSVVDQETKVHASEDMDLSEAHDPIVKVLKSRVKGPFQVLDSQEDWDAFQNQIHEEVAQLRKKKHG